MAKSTIFMVLTFYAATISAVPRIFGGHDAPNGKYPYLVSIRVYGDHYCGGSILNKHWILTAAHCVKGYFPDTMTVMVGSNLRKGGRTGKIYKVKYRVPHSQYNKDLDTQGDIGLIRVDGEIKFDDRIQPVNLPKSDVAELGTIAVLPGWGHTEIDDHPQKLQEITLKIYDLDKCKSYWKTPPYVVGDYQICTLNEAGEGACNGDSGGPLVVDGTQIGIISYADDCASGNPDVYTKVYPYLEWIDEQFQWYEWFHL